MDTNENLVPTNVALTPAKNPVRSDHLTQPRIGPQPMIEYYYENQASYNHHQQNCFVFSALSSPFLPNVGVPSMNAGLQKQGNCIYYQLVNNEQEYGCLMSRDLPYIQNVSLSRTMYQRSVAMKYWPGNQFNSALYTGEGDSFRPLRAKRNNRKLVSTKMHPVQLLHQIFRKEAFVMEYERMNSGPSSQVRVTYKVNGRTYQAEATRLKEARRLCAKQVLRDQFPDLQIESDDDIPQPEYDAATFANKHPVQILYQIFRHESIGIHCEEEGAAHFAKHIFAFVIRGTEYRATAETIKEAKRRAAILALNDHLKKERSGY